MKKILLLVMIGTILFCACVIFGGCAKKENVIKIGVIAPLSGNAAVYGRSLKNGMMIAETLINSGNSKQHIELIFENSKADSKEAVTAINKLINIDHVKCIIGDMFTSTTMAIAPIAKESQILLISPTASSQEISNIGPTIFRLYPSEIEEGKTLANFFIENINDPNVGILTLNEDAMLRVSKEINKIIGEKNISYSEIYSKEQTDYKTLISKIPLNIKEIFALGYMNDIALIVRQAKQLNKKITFICLSTLYDPKFLELAGNSADGVYLTAPYFDPDSKEQYIERFINEYVIKYDQVPDVWAGYGYDSVNICAKVINEANGNSLLAADILENLSGYNGVTGKTTITKDHGVNKQMRILRIENGEFVDVGVK